MSSDPYLLLPCLIVLESLVGESYSRTVRWYTFVSFCFVITVCSMLHCIKIWCLSGHLHLQDGYLDIDSTFLWGKDLFCTVIVFIVRHVETVLMHFICDPAFTAYMHILFSTAFREVSLWTSVDLNNYSLKQACSN